MQISLRIERGNNEYVSANVTEGQLYVSQRIAGFTKTRSHSNSLEREKSIFAIRSTRAGRNAVNQV